MFAIVLSEWLSNSHPRIEDERFISFGPFEFFECDGESSDHDEDMLQLLFQLISSNIKFENTPTAETYLRRLLTLTNYRKFYSMIQRLVHEISFCKNYDS